MHFLGIMEKGGSLKLKRKRGRSAVLLRFFGKKKRAESLMGEKRGREASLPFRALDIKREREGRVTPPFAFEGRKPPERPLFGESKGGKEKGEYFDQVREKKGGKKESIERPDRPCYLVPSATPKKRRLPRLQHPAKAKRGKETTGLAAGSSFSYLKLTG